MKKVFAALLIMVIALSSVVSAYAYTGVMYNDQIISTYANPDDTVNNPFDLGSRNYTSSFSFKSYSATQAIKVPADGKATVTLSNAYMDFSSTRTPTVYVKAYYWNGQTWKSATVTPSSVKVSKTKADYSFTVSGISKGSAFYVKLSKTEYSGYYFKGGITISD